MDKSSCIAREPLNKLDEVATQLSNRKTEQALAIIDDLGPGREGAALQPRLRVVLRHPAIDRRAGRVAMPDPVTGNRWWGNPWAAEPERQAASHAQRGER